MTLNDLAQLPQSLRDAAYDNTLAVANSSQQLADFEARSLALMASRSGQLDVRYAALERQTFDYFPGQPAAPTLLFIHGGYWQMRHKNSFRFVVEGALTQGLHAALMGYTLAPQASLTQIVSEVQQAIAAVRCHALEQGASGEVLLCGWSAGGHLAAMGLGCDGVIAGLGISGIYQLAPLVNTYLNHALQLSEQEVKALSPMNLPVVNKPFLTAFGTAELPQLQAQSLAFFQYRNDEMKNLLAVEGADHFSILNALADPHGLLIQRFVQVSTSRLR